MLTVKERFEALCSGRSIRQARWVDGARIRMGSRGRVMWVGPVAGGRVEDWEYTSHALLTDDDWEVVGLAVDERLSALRAGKGLRRRSWAPAAGHLRLSAGFILLDGRHTDWSVLSALFDPHKPDWEEVV